MKSESVVKLGAITCAMFAVLLSCHSSGNARDLLRRPGSEKRSYEFKFKYTPGADSTYMIRVKEEVAYDGKPRRRAEITNRVRTHVADVEGGRARILATVEVTEKAFAQGRKPFKQTTRYETEFSRDEFGEFDIDEEAFMPVVRNVPVFPKQPVSQGESWSAPAEEVHDFRRSFSVEDPVHVPFVANYTLERIEKDGAIAVISINYRVDSEISIASEPPVYPARMSGYSRQVLRWNIALGLPESVEETFSFSLHLSNGHLVMYSGDSKTTRLE